MSWGESQQPNPGQEPSGPWGGPTGPEGTAPYGTPPGPGEAYHSAPTQMYGGAPQQPDYAAPANPYGQPPQQQPFDPANPYGAPQQGYGAPPPQYGAQPQFGGYQPPAPPPPKKGNGLVIGLVVGAVVVVGGIGAAVALHKSGNPTPVAASTTAAESATTAAPEPTTAEPTTTDTGSAEDGQISLPQSSGSLILLNSPVAQQAVTRVKGGLSSSGDSSQVYQNALVGAYGPTTNGDPTTILVVQPFTNLTGTDQDAFENSSASTIVGGIMSGADATNVKTVQSSDPNAALSCGNVTSSGVSFYMCSWVDEDTFGVTYFYNKPDPATAGQQSDALRNGADHD